MFQDALLAVFYFYSMLTLHEDMLGCQTARGLPKKQWRAVLGRENKTQTPIVCPSITVPSISEVVSSLPGLFYIAAEEKMKIRVSKFSSSEAFPNELIPKSLSWEWCWSVR